MESPYDDAVVATGTLGATLPAIAGRITGRLLAFSRGREIRGRRVRATVAPRMQE